MAATAASAIDRAATPEQAARRLAVPDDLAPDLVLHGDEVLAGSTRAVDQLPGGMRVETQSHGVDPTTRPAGGGVVVGLFLERQDTELYWHFSYRRIEDSLVAMRWLIVVLSVGSGVAAGWAVRATMVRGQRLNEAGPVLPRR